jgi:hypothetical protein
MVYVTGSTHGGNWAHNLTLSDVSLDGANNNLLDDCAPTQTKDNYSDGFNLTVTLQFAPLGVGGSASHTFTLWGDPFGPRGFGAEGSNFYKWGWRGHKGCCDYIGIGGGANFKIPEGKPLSFVFGQWIEWQAF